MKQTKKIYLSFEDILSLIQLRPIHIKDIELIYVGHTEAKQIKNC